MPLFLDRLEAIDGIRGKYRVLSSEEVRSAKQIGKDLLSGSTNREKFVARLDATDLDSDNIREWLKNVEMRGQVTLVWLSTQDGVEVDYLDFVTYFDEFWYPSSDDVWVISSDGKSILDMDHEEVFSLFRQNGKRSEDSSY